MPKPLEVEIIWGLPHNWDMILGLSNQVPGPCIYQITRDHGATETLLYIGIVWSERRTFYIRMNEHKKKLVSNLRGIRYRLGHVNPLDGSVCDRDLMEEVEGALILEHQPEHNSKKKKSFSIRLPILLRQVLV
jgi:hypothetical protein